MKKRLIQLSTLFVITIIFIQCSITGPITTKDTDQLDPNFAGYTGVLLIERDHGKNDGFDAHDRIILKSFRRDYKGEVLPVTKRELDKYTDIDKYRFIVTPVVANEVVHSGSRNIVVAYSRIRLKDRKTEKETETKTYGGSKAFKQFARVFEALRTSK